MTKNEVTPPIPSPNFVSVLKDNLEDVWCVINSIVGIINSTYATDEITGERLDEPGKASAADIVEALCGMELAVVEAFSFLENTLIKNEKDSLPAKEPERTLKILVACSDAGGIPTLVPLRWKTTQKKIDEGQHYDDIIEHMKDNDYEGEYVVLDEGDMLNCGEPIRSAVEGIDWLDMDTCE